jgi:hypothetical protein
MLTACLVILVIIAFYGYKAYVANGRARLEQVREMNEQAQQRQIQQAHAMEEQARQRQIELAHWKMESKQGTRHVELVLSYSEMKMTTHIRDRSVGGYLADMFMHQKTTWERFHEALERDGWTNDEWMKHEIRQFDVRRLPDGTWEHRLTWKRWRALVLEEWESQLPGSERYFKELTTLTKKEWEERGDYDNDAFRPWTKFIEDGSAIETGYQRFIHNKP